MFFLNLLDSNHSRSISQELSTRTESPYLNPYAPTFKKSQISNSSSDITFYDNQKKISTNKKKKLHKNDFPIKFSQKSRILKPSFLNLDTAQSDNEGVNI